MTAFCTTYEWSNPNVPESLWRRDEVDCVGRATAKVEEEVAREEVPLLRHLDRVNGSMDTNTHNQEGDFHEYERT